jgi:hypothetical protein
MPKVWADDEEVIFNEGIPEDSQKIYELLMGALSEQRKTVVEFMVDGVDALATNTFPEDFSEIKAVSMSHDEVTLRISEASIAQTENLETEISAYSKNILSTPWSVVVKQMDQFIAKIQPFADIIDNVAPYASAYTPPWSKKVNDIAQLQAACLSRILNAFETNNPSSLSEEVHTIFIPLLKNIKQLFTSEVIPQLREVVSTEKKST